MRRTGVAVAMVEDLVEVVVGLPAELVERIEDVSAKTGMASNDLVIVAVAHLFNRVPEDDLLRIIRTNLAADGRN